jgi:hypothetical protein
MAGTKEITPEALENLGLERLAELLAGACENDRALRRKVQILLASKRGAGKLRSVIAKRITGLTRNRKLLGQREVPALVAELTALRQGIVAELAAKDPPAAVELLWRFLDLAKTTIERAGSSGAAIAGPFHVAAENLGSLLDQLPELDAISLAERLHADLATDDHWLIARIISSGACGLGVDGRARLRALLKADIAQLPARKKNAFWTKADWRRGGLCALLVDLANADGDVDAFIEANELGEAPFVNVAHIAERLIAANRATEALSWLDRLAPGFDDVRIVGVRVAALDSLGRTEEAQRLRLRAFEKTLNADLLREYLKRLPDFEDVEAERKAIEHAGTFSKALTALCFLVEWPALEAADALVRRRMTELEGGYRLSIGEAAERLGEKWPISATLLYRAHVLSVLDGGLARVYENAARDLSSALVLAKRLPPDSGIPDHAAFVASLGSKYGRLYGFWNIVAGKDGKLGR